MQEASDALLLKPLLQCYQRRLDLLSVESLAQAGADGQRRLEALASLLRFALMYAQLPLFIERLHFCICVGHGPA